MYWKLEKTPMISIPKRREPLLSPELAESPDSFYLPLEVDTTVTLLQQCQCYYFCEVDKGKIHLKHDSGMIVRII